MATKRVQAKKRESVSITSTKVSLNLKGKRVDLTLDELRHLGYLINRTLSGASIVSTPWFSPLTVTNATSMNINGATMDLTNPCSAITLGADDFDLDNKLCNTTSEVANG